MSINFPNSPALNDIFTAGTTEFKWDGSKWVAIVPSIKTVNGSSLLGSGDINISAATLGALPTSGGTMTGPITFDVNQTWPTFNQNTTGSAAKLTTGKSFVIGNTTRNFDGTLDVVWTLADIGAQASLVSGTNIKTINGTSLLGSGDIAIAGGGSSVTTISNKTANYTVVAGDLGSIINVSGVGSSSTISLTSATTLGSGFRCWIWNSETVGTYSVTIDPAGSEKIDNMSTLVLRNGEGVEVICDGTGWQTGSKKSMRSYADNIPSTYTVRPTASGANAIAIGASNAAGSYSIAIGYSNNTSGSYSAAIGGQSVSATGTSTLCLGGYNNSVTGNYSTIVGGTYNTVVAVNSIACGYGANVTTDGKWAYSSSPIVSAGDNQTGIMVLGAATTSATPTVLKSSASAAGTSNQVILPNNSAFAFSGLIVARQKTSDGTNSAAWRVEGLLLRGATAATTSLVNSATTVISNVPGWTLTLTADTTNGGLAVTATGAAATNIYWVATIQTSEVTYA